MTHETIDRTYATDSAPALDRRWKTWPDWVNLVLGVYIALAPLWTAGATASWFVTLGVLVAVVSLWALGTASSSGAEGTQIVLGAILFLAPWMGGFSAAAAATWTAWIAGIAVIVFAVVAINQQKKLAA